MDSRTVMDGNLDAPEPSAMLAPPKNIVMKCGNTTKLGTDPFLMIQTSDKLALRILCKCIFLLIAANLIGSVCLAQTNSSAQLFLNREKPKKYEATLSKLMIAEVNDYAARLELPEHFPITSNSVTELFVTSPFVARNFGALGSIRTTNFSYGFGKGRHLSYITRVIKGTNPYDFNANKLYAIEPSSVNTNAAFMLATQFLAKAFVDINRLSTSSVVSIHPWTISHMTTSKYTVQWSRGGHPVVKVVLAEPQRELWTLRVEDPTLVLRSPLEVPDPGYLSPEGSVSATTNYSR
jgi:hypothetical protein